MTCPYLTLTVSACILLCHQSEGETHQQTLPAFCGSRPGDTLLCGEGEAEWSCLLLFLYGTALHCSYGGSHRPQVSPRKTFIHLLDCYWISGWDRVPQFVSFILYRECSSILVTSDSCISNLHSNITLYSIAFFFLLFSLLSSSSCMQLLIT